MPKVRIVEATRHPGDERDVLRLVVMYLTDTDKEIGRRTIDNPIDAGQAVIRASIAAEWQSLQSSTLPNLVGNEYTF